jgi:hypothetical protein
VSGGVPPYTFCTRGLSKNQPIAPIPNPCAGHPPTLCPGGIALSESGLFKGQAKCGPWYDTTGSGKMGASPTICKGISRWVVQVQDSCPSGVQSIVKEFWIKLEAL